jgi:hypothetical protein
MGKGGKGKGNSGGGGKKKPMDDEDALLDAAIAQAGHERAEQKEAARKRIEATCKAAQKAAEAQAAAGTTLTMEQTLAKLDTVMTFTISRLTEGGAKDLMPSPSGAITFYLDPEDVQADLAALKAAHPETKLGLAFAPLGRAFALMQGLLGLRAPGPTKIEFSRAIATEVGEAGVPEELRERMRGAGPFPLFYSDKLGSEAFTPCFFSRDDLAAFWCSTGGVAENVPEPSITDLRIIVMRTLQEPGQWEPLHYIPPQKAESLSKQLIAQRDKEKAEHAGFVAGGQRLAAAAKAVALEDGDEPPPLS